MAQDASKNVGQGTTSAGITSDRGGPGMYICECGQPGTEVCYRRGSSHEIWFCGARKHRARIQDLAAQGWLSQSPTVAASPTGTAVRRHLQAA